MSGKLLKDVLRASIQSGRVDSAGALLAVVELLPDWEAESSSFEEKVQEAIVKAICATPVRPPGPIPRRGGARPQHVDEEIVVQIDR